MKRRNFLQNAGALLGGAAMFPKLAKAERVPHFDASSWSSVREQFMLDPNYIHMAQMLLASHPKPVRDEIERHRLLFDQNPAEYWETNFMEMEPKISAAAGAYLNADSEEVALTDSTSMGLATLYNGFKLKPGDEVLTTIHDHFATEKSLEYTTAKNGAPVRRITLYQNPATVSAQEIVDIVAKAIKPATRLVAVTWVHSSTGVKLPVKEIGAAIAKANAQRSPASRIYFCVDGVHNFGIENIDVKALGCDFLAAGTHKWLFGPRGTGILYGKKDAWHMVAPTIPSFTGTPYGIWLGAIPDAPVCFRNLCTPGGFHSFEHRWSLPKAFEFHQQIGKAAVESRTHELATMVKEGLQKIKHVTVITPMSPALSAGINCFEVAGIAAEEVVKKLLAKKIIASASPYKVSYVRLTPNIANTEEEINVCLKEIADMA